MKLIIKIACLLLLASTSAVAQVDDCITAETQGYNMLLMGHSFFQPYANRIDDLAIDAGFINHNQTFVFSSGGSGFPINLWNDTGANNQQIKAKLDAGNVDVFGMVADSRQIAGQSLEGHINWIDYALQNNPDITIFLAISSPNFPNDWVQTAQQSGFATVQAAFEAHITANVHIALVDQLRIEFPSTKIFTIPTGKASIALWQMFQDDLLLDDISFIDDFENSLFTDDQGHQGEITAQTGALMWLKALYNVDLTTNDYDTGFKTDLHVVAEDAMNSHDLDYSLCFADHPSVTCESSYSVILEENITYASGLTHDGISAKTAAIPLKLDVYVPDNDSENRPVYMFIHGGGFTGGSKTQQSIVDMADYFASRGWVFVSINYRTTQNIGTIHTGIVPQEWEAAISQIPNPAGIPQFLAIYTAQRDAKAAMRWIVANADNYNINTDFITVGGGSAGAITAVTLGVSNNEDFRDEISQTDDPTLATTNLDQTYEIKSIVDFWGGNVALETLETIYGHHRFDSNDPNLFIAHGTTDPTVLFSEAEELVQLYDSTGVYAELIPLVGQGHASWNAIVVGKSLSDLSFEFLVAQQELILDDYCLTTSAPDIKASENYIDIFPNPVVNQFTINGTLALYQIDIIDATGQIIQTVNNVGNSHTIDISALPFGLYFVSVRNLSNNLLEVQKIIKY